MGAPGPCGPDANLLRAAPSATPHTAQEDDVLTALIKQHGPHNWAFISEVGGGRRPPKGVTPGCPSHTPGASSCLRSRAPLSSWPHAARTFASRLPPPPQELARALGPEETIWRSAKSCRLR